MHRPSFIPLCSFFKFLLYCCPVAPSSFLPLCCFIKFLFYFYTVRPLAGLHDVPLQCSMIMAKLSTSFLTLENEETCLLCQLSLKKSDKINVFTEQGWPKLISNALKWKGITLPVDHQYYLFPSVYDTLKDAETAFGRAHEACRIVLCTKGDRFRKRFEVSLDEKKAPTIIDDEKQKPDAPLPPTLNTRASNTLDNGTCFVCLEQRKCDHNAYNKGGLAKLSNNTASLPRLNSRTKEYLKDSTHPLYQEACRFTREINCIRAEHEIYFHQSCYIRYVISSSSFR